MSELTRYTYNMSSSQRSRGTLSDCFFNISQVVNLKATNSLFKIVVHNATIPFSFYQLGSDINTLSCTFVNNGNSKTATVTIPAGNYTTVSVLAQLSSVLTTICQTSSGSYVGYTPVFNFTYSTVTCKSTLQLVSGGTTASIVLPFQNNLNLGGFFGFSTNQTISIASTPVSTKIAVANPVSYLLLRCGNMRQFQNREFVVEKDVFSDIVYKIPVQTQTNTWLHSYYDSDHVYIQNDIITNFNFYLTTNLTYTPVDLQGVDWSFSFSLIETLLPEFKSLTTTLLASKQTNNEMNIDKINEQNRIELEKQLQENLAKLDKYKKRLKKINSDEADISIEV